MKQEKRKKIGLALGSGGMKGYAHLGVLKVLQENNIPIDYIAGTSAGAVVGAYYSVYNGDLDKIEKAITNWKELRSLFDISLKGGIIKGRKAFDFLDKSFEGKHFKDLGTPFCAVATDYKTCEEIRIKKGDVALAVRASMSVPYFLNTVKTKGRELVDGGLSSPVPVNAVREMGADIVIAVRIEDKLTEKNKKNLYSMNARAMTIMQHNLSEHEISDCDILIDPYLEDYGILGFQKIFQGKIPDTIEAGIKATEKQIFKINQACAGALVCKKKGIYKL